MRVFLQLHALVVGVSLEAFAVHVHVLLLWLAAPGSSTSAAACGRTASNNSARGCVQRTKSRQRRHQLLLLQCVCLCKRVCQGFQVRVGDWCCCRGNLGGCGDLAWRREDGLVAHHCLKFIAVQFY